MAFVFLGNTGVKEFKHICSEDGEFTSWFIKLDDHCEDHQKYVPPCCQKEEKKDDCCNDEVKVYQFSFEFFEDDQLEITSTSVFYLQRDFQLVKEERYVSELQDDWIHLRPPPIIRPGRELLNFIQVYRI
jgi:hypothetical protein